MTLGEEYLCITCEYHPFRAAFNTGTRDRLLRAVERSPSVESERYDTYDACEMTLLPHSDRRCFARLAITSALRSRRLGGPVGDQDSISPLSTGLLTVARMFTRTPVQRFYSWLRCPQVAVGPSTTTTIDICCLHTIWSPTRRHTD